MKLIRDHRELDVYQLAYQLALEIQVISQRFPREEIYSLTSQIRRSSRSVAANLAEAYRKRRYEKSFTAKLSDAEGEAAETQTWLDMARDSHSPTLPLSHSPTLPLTSYSIYDIFPTV